MSLAQAGGPGDGARKGGDGGAPTHHGERSARVGAGRERDLTESESLGKRLGRSGLQMGAPGSGVEVQHLGPPRQLKGKGCGEGFVFVFVFWGRGGGFVSKPLRKEIP